MADGQIVFEITADGKKAVAQVRDVANALQREMGNTERQVSQSADNMTASMARALDINRVKDWALKAAGAIKQFIGDSIGAASSLREVQNVVDVTFGDSAETINSWAKNAITQFGLTETQAKQFSSTMGAMMKSAGLAGPEITKVSTDLAGLAADMASFYNMDFETAFQKIRSGIAGETEPLKQLGINMSVANLQAFAMTQGITKAFDKMSQGEQTMLRYQYLMQATADAQGDFARTSDGMANGLRLLESNFESLKTKIGTALIPIVESAISSLNNMLSAMQPTKGENLMTQLRDIDTNAATKQAEIQATADQARALIETLEQIGSIDIHIDSADVNNWETFLSGLNNGGIVSLAGNGKTAADNIKLLAGALAGQDENLSKAEAFAQLMETFKGSADELKELTGIEDINGWIEGLAESASKLDPADAQGWDTLMNSIVSAFGNTKNGQFFLNNLGGVFSDFAVDANEASKYLQALGIDSENVADKQAAWLDVCKKLVDTMPGLSALINTETGEVKGGAQALKLWVDEWERLSNNNLLKTVMEQRFQVAEQAHIEEMSSGLDLRTVENKLKEANAKLEELRKKYGIHAGATSMAQREFVLFGDWMIGGQREELSNEGADEWNKAVTNRNNLLAEQNRLTKEHEDAQEAATKADEAAATAAGEYASAMEGVENSTDGATEAVKQFGITQDQAADKSKALADAAQKLADYVAKVKDETRQAIDSAVSGFGKMVTPMDQTREKLARLTAERDKYDKQQSSLDAKSRDKDYEKRIANYNSQIKAVEAEYVTVQSMIDGLDSQLDYLEKYNRYMTELRAAGLSDEVAAMLSDGSTQSFDYLEAMWQNHQKYTGTGNKDTEIETINTKYRSVQQRKDQLGETLTESKLDASAEMQQLVEAFNQAMADLDVQEVAYDNADSAAKAIANALAANFDGIKTNVDAIVQQLDRLAGFGNLSLKPGTNSGFSFKFGAKGSFASGVDYVPYDDFPALLHRGESVLTATEAKLWRQYSNSQYNSGLDYQAIGNAVRDSGGGNVYLDGRIVGHVLSQSQANSYKSLQRSGWSQ